MWQKFGDYQLNRFRHTQQNLLEEAGGGADFVSPQPKFWYH